MFIIDAIFPYEINHDEHFDLSESDDVQQRVHELSRVLRAQEQRITEVKQIKKKEKIRKAMRQTQDEIGALIQLAPDKFI